MLPASFSLRVKIWIFAIAFLVRLIFVHFFATPPVNDLLWNDAVGWNLAQGNGYTASEPRVPGIYRTPGYPAFLAVIYLFFGHSYHAAYVAQALLDAGSAILLGAIAIHYLPASVAALASFLYAIYPYPAIFCGVLHQDILLIFSTLVVLLFLARAIKTDENHFWFLVGLAAGVSALVKANMILFILVPVISIFFYFRTERVKRLTLLFVSMILVLTPWIIRNYVIFGSFPPLAAGATGTNLRLLVLELNGGEQAVREWGRAAPNTELSKLMEDGRPLIDSEKQTAARALTELKRRWPEYTLVVLKHIPRLWISKYSRWHSHNVALAGNILSWMVLIPGVLGMFLLRKRWKELLPLYLTVIWITLMYAPYTVESRYTLPARAVMLCFVAAAVVALFSKVTRALQPDPSSLSRTRSGEAG
jgi:4-amino-4-deoxy-L-arabinose transferase-like glycosyltransferase